MDKNGRAIARMIELARERSGAGWREDELSALRAHDPSDPFCTTSIDKDVFSTRYWVRFCGNCVNTPGGQAWVDESGRDVETPRPLSLSWAKGVGEKLAADLTAAGKDSVVSIGGGGEVEKERIKVVVPTHHQENRNTYPGSISSHYFVLHVWMQAITGEKELRTFRVDSVGREDIASRVIAHIDRLADAMPRDRKEAERKGYEHAHRIVQEAFARHDIEPDLISLTRSSNGGGLTFDVYHRMTNTLMEKYECRDQVRFNGDRVDDPWRSSLSSLGRGTRDADIAAEAKRRTQVEKNGGLIQTSLVKRLIELNGLKSVPLRSDYGGDTKSSVFHLKTDPPTRVRMFVKDGRLEAEVHIGKNMRITTGSISVDEIDAPETAIRGLKGKPLRNLIDHPLVTDDMTITSATPKGLNVRARIRMDSHPVERRQSDAE